MPCESLGKSLQTCLSQDKSGFPDALYDTMGGTNLIMTFKVECWADASIILNKSLQTNWWPNYGAFMLLHRRHSLRMSMVDCWAQCLSGKCPGYWAWVTFPGYSGTFYFACLVHIECSRDFGFYGTFYCHMSGAHLINARTFRVFQDILFLHVWCLLNLMLCRFRVFQDILFSHVWCTSNLMLRRYRAFWDILLLHICCILNLLLWTFRAFQDILFLHVRCLLNLMLCRFRVFQDILFSHVWCILNLMLQRYQAFRDILFCMSGAYII
jgi:hypothetical protein